MVIRESNLPGDDLQFWARLAVQRWLEQRAAAEPPGPRHAAGSNAASPVRPAMNDTALPPDVWDLLWAFVEDRCDEEQEARFGAILAQHPGALAELARLLELAEEILRLPSGDPQRVWERLAAALPGHEAAAANAPAAPNAAKPSAGANAPRVPDADAAHQPASATASPPATTAPSQQLAWTQRLADLVVRLSQRGLELLSSSGRPAFAPAAARSGLVEDARTAAQEYFVPAGTFRVTVQRAQGVLSAGRAPLADVVVSVVRLAPRWNVDALDVELWDADLRHCLRTEPIAGRSARLAGLPGGTYCLCVVQEQQRLTELRVVIAVQED